MALKSRRDAEVSTKVAIEDLDAKAKAEEMSAMLKEKQGKLERFEFSSY